MSDNAEIKTHFKGPGQWRSQAKKLEEESLAEEKKSLDTPEE